MQDTESNKSNLRLEDAKLKSLFIYFLTKVYYAKEHIIRNVPYLIKHASFIDLRHALEENLEEAIKQRERIVKIFDFYGESIKKETSLVIDPVVKEAHTAIDRNYDYPLLKDMAIILYAQMIEHIELSSLNMVKSIAEALKVRDIYNLLQECVDESTETDQLYSVISKYYIDREVEQ